MNPLTPSRARPIGDDGEFKPVYLRFSVSFPPFRGFSVADFQRFQRRIGRSARFHFTHGEEFFGDFVCFGANRQFVFIFQNIQIIRPVTLSFGVTAKHLHRIGGISLF